MATITNIYSLIKLYTKTNDYLSNINIDVTVTSAREYKTMVFLELCDGTESIGGIAYGDIYNGDLHDGDMISLIGHLDVYRGKIQIVLDAYCHIGKVTDTAFTILRDKLEKLGLLGDKPPLPTDVTKLGIITSINAAGLKDFIQTINTRSNSIKIYIYPASMQGKNAHKEIINSIVTANEHHHVELLALIRGGGAREDLDCFDNEELAYSIHRSNIPIVTGIGHQIDTTIADLVAAKSYITPTAAAQHIPIYVLDTTATICHVRDMLSTAADDTYYYLDDASDVLEHSIDEIQRDICQINDICLKTKNNIKPRIADTMNGYHDYLSQNITDEIEKFSDHLHTTQEHTHYIQDMISSRLGSIIPYLEYSDSSLTAHQSVNLLDKDGNTVTSVQSLKKGQYTLQFMDGSINIDINI